MRRHTAVGIIIALAFGLYTGTSWAATNRAVAAVAALLFEAATPTPTPTATPTLTPTPTPTATGIPSGAIIIDHNCRDLAVIPTNWIRAAQDSLKVHYGHTSHGHQLEVGAETLALQDGRYAVDIGIDTLPNNPGHLCVYDGNGYSGDNYIMPEMYWLEEAGRQHTTNTLHNHPTINVSMWAWCGQLSDNDSDYVNNYLNTMAAFEQQFPQVKFVYFTGHLDGTGSAGNLHQRNEQIRTFCRNNNKVLFDFADIERYDPNGTDYLNLGAGTGGEGNACQYNSGNWATTWCTLHPGDARCADGGCPDCCDHSQPLNCNLKARAFWWLMARLAGWNGL